MITENFDLDSELMWRLNFGKWPSNDEKNIEKMFQLLSS